MKSAGFDALPPPSATPTLVDVARLAGVSTATVSRYLNTPDLLAESTAARVRLAVEQIGYVPNMMAGGLASSRSRLIAMIVPMLDQSIFTSTIQAITNALAEQGYQILLGLSGLADERLEEVLPSILGRKPDGIILTGTLTSPLLRKRLLTTGVPIIETWDLPANPVDSAVGFSHAAIGRAIGDHIVQRGYRRPFVLSTGGVRALARRYGLSQVMIENGRPEPPSLTVAAPTNFSSGRRALAALLDDGADPDVIICASDWLAHGVMAEALNRGLDVPGDLAIIGFGDHEFAANLTVPLTSIAIDGAAIARETAALLMARAQGAARERMVIDVGFQLIARASA